MGENKKVSNNQNCFLASFFSGIGGMDLGVSKFLPTAKIKIAIDMIEDNAYVYKQLFKYVDVSEHFVLESDKSFFIPKPVEGSGIEKIKDFPFAGVIGGPPCQDFSLLREAQRNRPGIKTERGRLVEYFGKLVKNLNPAFFIFENVRGLLSTNNGSVEQKILQAINGEEIIKSKRNTNKMKLVFSSIVDFSFFGVPQHRVRFLLVGIRNDLIKKNSSITQFSPESLPVEYHFPLTPLEVFEGRTIFELKQKYREIMADYEELFDKIESSRNQATKTYYEKIWEPCYRKGFDIFHDFLYLNNIDLKELGLTKSEARNIIKREHESWLKELGFWKKPVEEIDERINKPPKNTETVKKRMNIIPPWGNYLFANDTEYAVKGVVSFTYRRLHPLMPSYTIIGRGGGGTYGYHYLRERIGLTLREIARLQTFPDELTFSGTLTRIRQQLGDAVPPFGIYKFLNWLKKENESFSELIEMLQN